MNSVDKDYRFMATNDLITALQHEYFKLDDESEKKVMTSFHIFESWYQPYINIIK